MTLAWVQDRVAGEWSFRGHCHSGWAEPICEGGEVGGSRGGWERGSTEPKPRSDSRSVIWGICCIAHLLVFQFSYLKGLIPPGLLSESRDRRGFPRWH